MGKRLHVLAASLSRDLATSRLENAWIYWKQDGDSLLLRVDANGNVLKFTGGPKDDPKSYTDLFVVEEGATVRAAHSIEPKPHEEALIEERFQDFEVKQSLSASLAKITKIVLSPDGRKKQVDIEPLAKATIKMQAAPPIDAKDVMLVPNVPVAADPRGLNAEIRLFGEQWKKKDPAHRELVLVAPGTNLNAFKTAMSDAAQIARGRTVILNVGHGSDLSASRASAFFDITPRINNAKGRSAEATGAMFRDDVNNLGARDARILALEEAGKAFEQAKVNLFVILACRVGSPAAEVFMQDVSFALRTAIQGYKQKVLSQVVTDSGFVVRSATLLEIEGAVPVGLSPTSRFFTEIPTKFKTIISRQFVKPTPSD